MQSNRPQVAARSACFKKIQAHEYICTTWFERDRAYIALSTPRGRVVFELWDDAVLDAIDAGHLKPPSVPRPCDCDWLPAAVQYAIDMHLIPAT